MSPVRPGEPPVVPGCELEALIGEGGVGQVWRGRYKGVPVAVKVYSRPDRPALRRRFVREGRLLQRLSHPGLVRCLQVIEADAPALVLELLQGLALDRRIARAPLTGVEAIGLARGLLDVLGFLHGNGIVHRDVKSGNVWMADDGRVILMDLGLAVDPADPVASTLGEVIGTYAYMAPEQLAGGEIDHRADLYSLGVTLYEAVAGVRPYTARGAARWLVAHRSGGARPLSEVAPGTPAELAVLVDRLMARDPSHRPGSASTALTLLTGSSLGLATSSAPLIGRAGALGAIHALVDAGGVLRISGEVGSGVGAVLHAARGVAEEAGRIVVSLRARANARPEDVAAQIARELDGLVGRVEPTREGARLGLVALAEHHEVLVVIEDLDIARPETAEWLEEIAAIERVALLVGGFRLGPHPAGRSFPLRGLDDAEVYDLVSALLGSAAVPPGLDLRLGSLTGRLPGLIVPALRDLVARGAVWCEEGENEAAGPWRWDATVRNVGTRDAAQLFERGFSGVSAAARAVLRVMAVAAGPLPLEIAVTASGADEEDARALAREGLVLLDIRNAEEWISLRRGYLEIAVRATIDPEAVREIHAAIATGLRARPRPAPWERVSLAIHTAAGFDDLAAARQVLEMADQFARAGRADTALELVDRLPTIPVGEVEAHVAFAAVRAEALLALGRHADAEAALQAAEALGAECPDPARAERFELMRADLELQAGHGLAAIRDRLAPFATARPPARAAVLLGEVALRRAELVEAELWFERATVQGVAPQADRLAWRARIGRCDAASARGDAERATTALAQLAREMRTGPLVRERAVTLARLAAVRLRRGELAEARARLEEAAEAARATSSPLVRVEIELVHAEMACVFGQVDDAVRRLARLSPYGSPQAPFALRSAFLRGLADVRAARRDRPALLAVHVGAAETAAEAGDVLLEAWHSGMAAILTADDATFSRAFDDITAAGAAPLAARLLFELGRLGRDSNAWSLAEAQARRADEQLLLLEILHYGRGEGAQEEAASIVARALEGITGAPRRAFLSRRDVAWALDGPEGGARDTRA